MYQSLTTSNNRFPAEGPKTVPVLLEFTGPEIKQIDMMLDVQQKKITTVQGVFFNNKNGPDCELVVDESFQSIVIAAGKQGVLQLLTPSIPRFTISANGAGAIRLHFVNFPVITKIF